MSTSSMSQEMKEFLADLKQDPRWKPLMEAVLKMPSPPRYKPSSRVAEARKTDERISLDWAYQSGEYEKVRKIRKFLLNEED